MAKKEEINKNDPQLFEKDEDAPITRTFYVPDKEAYNRVKKGLVELYTAERLKIWSTVFLNFMKTKSYQVVGTGNGVMANCLGSFLKAKRGTKDETACFLAYILSDVRNFSIYLDELPQGSKNGWKAAIEKVYIPLEEFNKKKGCKYVDSDFTWDGYFKAAAQTKGTELFFFKSNTFYSLEVFKSVRFLELNSIIYNLSLPYFFPPSPLKTVGEKQPEEEGLIVKDSSEKEFLEQLPILKSLTEQGILQVKDNGKVLLSVRKKVVQQAGIKEYFPDSHYTDQAYYRSSLVLMAVGDYFTSNKKIASVDKPEKLCKHILANVKRHSSLFANMMPHLSSIKQDMLWDVSERLNSLFDGVVKLIQSKYGWISIDKIVRGLLAFNFPNAYYTIFSAYQLSYIRIFRNKKLNKEILLTDLHEQVYVPYIKSILFLLNALGLADVAYMPSLNGVDKDVSYVDRLRYVRLTPLGAYVTGLTNAYTPPQVETKKYFELDDKMLILKSLSDDNPFEGLVSDVAQPIGKGRFIVTPESFLKSCKTDKDMDSKMELFKEFVSDSELPVVWTEFFQTMKAKCKPLKPVDIEEYKLYSVSPDNKELLHLLATDTVLRKYIFRVEGYMLLIPKKEHTKVVNRLKTFGYLL